MIELKNVNKIYDDGFQALTDVNVEFQEGKINVLIGPSGCGKTTTMKLLNRLVDYTDGEVYFNGKKIKDVDPIKLRRQMGFVIQNIGLFPHMTIFNNVATVPKLLKWDKDKIKKRVIELLEMVNLDPDTYMNRYPSELSGGQQQRIGVIRALAAEPSTILMDEPFSALDPISREQLQDELLRLQTEINKTIIFVTHDMDEALKIADYIVLMKDGKVVQQGSPESLLSNPANDFVKEFIGEKRLQSSNHLNDLSLSDYTETSMICIHSNLDIAKAATTLIKAKVASAVVINEDETCLGVVSLYDAIENNSSEVKNITKEATLTINEHEDMSTVLKKVEGIHEIVPILSKDDKVVGLLNTDKLFATLHHLTECKRGEV